MGICTTRGEDCLTVPFVGGARKTLGVNVRAPDARGALAVRLSALFETLTLLRTAFVVGANSKQSVLQAAYGYANGEARPRWRPLLHGSMRAGLPMGRMAGW